MHAPFFRPRRTFATRRRLPAVVGTALTVLSPLAGAAGEPDGGISLSQTRVVFLSSDKAQTLTIKNTGQRAWLIQSRVQRTPEDSAAAPFVVTPPLFTLPPDSRQLVRILSQGATLPADRESLFTLAVLAIPAAEAQAAAEGAQGTMSMGMRFTLKLFYRPAALADGAEAAACRLQFTPTPGGVRVANPTPYFQTVGQLRLNGTPLNLDRLPSMLVPFGHQDYPADHGGHGQADWQTIADHGGLSARCQQTF